MRITRPRLRHWGRVDMATPLTDAINALTAYANEVTGESDTTLSDAVRTLGSGYGGGTTITDGVIVTARNANGRTTAVEKYGNCGGYEFGVDSGGYTAFPYGFLNSVVLHNCTELGYAAFKNKFIQTITGLENITKCDDQAFMQSGMPSINLPSATSIGGACFRSLSTTCKSVILPVVQTMGNNVFQQSTGLESVQIGSDGHPAPLASSVFIGCTQSGLTITAYQTGANVDTLVSRYRSGATNATIIIKASEATTYNGTSYAAGDTMLTSTP